jgi:hypothetical protein
LDCIKCAILPMLRIAKMLPKRKLRDFSNNIFIGKLPINMVSELSIKPLEWWNWQKS